MIVESSGVTHADFVHLRVHTAYSLSEGALSVEEAVRLAKEQRMPALAITDSGNLFGALEFGLEAAKSGVQPIIGCELGLARDGDVQPAQRAPKPDRVVLLVQSEAGYRNLMVLSSAAFLDTEPPETPHVSWDKLAAHAEGLILLTGGVAGPVGRLLFEGRRTLAEAALARLATMFPGRAYVELQRHGMEAEERIEHALLELAYAQDVPLVATNEPYFADASMSEAHDALLCIADGAYVSEPNRRRVTPEHRFKSAAEMRALFADLPEAVDNTLVVARRCAYMPPKRDPILPRFPLPAGQTEVHLLGTQARAGLDRRIAAKAEPERGPYRDRLDYELGVIGNMGFAGYFLLVADFIRYAKEKGIPVGPGRGSGAGSVAAWALNITDLDPLQFGLLFERFLNPHRISMPDFDIDFCQERRDEVIQYVQRTYGADRVAQIITFGSLQARAALRDVGRVLELPYGQVDRICKMVPHNPANPVSLADAISGEPRLQAERDGDERVAKMLDIAEKLEGLYRHASTHAAGVVIGDRPLVELVPLYRDPRSSMPATQFSMKWVEAAGLVKFDFLGLKTLDVIDKTVKLLKSRGVDFDISALPLDDATTYAMLTRGETMGVFQLESEGMRNVTREVRPNTLEDIIVIVALYRPGPMQDIPKYVAAKHGREEPGRLHELIDPVVRDTYGVIVYQEQVMQIAQVFAGFSMAEADNLRRAMGKKIKAEMEAMRERFVAGATAKGIPLERVTHVFEVCARFAGYGFNKAHSAGYGLIAYQTAYLKAHHPVEFLAASMTVDLGNTDKLGIFRQEAKRMHIPVLPPDINRSVVEFSVEDIKVPGASAPAIRYALAAVRNVGAQAMHIVVRERSEKGPYKSLADFALRLDPKSGNRRQIENLALAGAFDELEEDRSRVHAGVEMILRHANSAASEREAGQTNLFAGSAGTDRRFVLPPAEVWSSMERLKREREALGLYLSAHPLEAYAGVLAAKRVTKATDLPARLAAGATSVTLAGTVERRTERRSARGNRFAHVAFSDPTGDFEVTFFSEVLSTARSLLEPGTSVLVTAEAGFVNEAIRLTAQGVQSLDEVAAQHSAGLRVWLEGPEPLVDIAKILGQAGGAKAGGKGAEVAIVVRRSPLMAGALGREIEILLPGRFALTPAVREALARTPGIAGLQEA